MFAWYIWKPRLQHSILVTSEPFLFTYPLLSCRTPFLWHSWDSLWQIWGAKLSSFPKPPRAWYHLEPPGEEWLPLTNQNWVEWVLAKAPGWKMEGRGRSVLGSAETEKWKYKKNFNTLIIWILIGFFYENFFESRWSVVPLKRLLGCQLLRKLEVWTQWRELWGLAEPGWKGLRSSV